MPYDLSIPDVLTHKRPNPATRRHEAEKPVELLLDLLRMCARPGDVGCDTFAGSHNFIEACQRHGCHSVTIESDPVQVMAAAIRYGAVSHSLEVRL
jgi:DNA modification methylase